MAALQELKKLIIERRNMAHINCLEKEKQTYNDVINIIDSVILKEECHHMALIETRKGIYHCPICEKFWNEKEYLKELYK